MPVRSLDSSVLEWPRPGEVLRALAAWAKGEVAKHPDLRRLGYFGSFAREEAGVGSDLDLRFPAIDPLDEEVRGRVERLDRQPEVVRELQEREPGILATRELHHIDVLGRAPGFDPQGDQGAAEQEPVPLDPFPDLVHDRPDPLAVHTARIGAMVDAWKLLVDLGLPDRAARPIPRGPIDLVAVRAAVLAVARSPELEVAKVAPMLAWLSAWRHHWAPSFARVFRGRDIDILDDLRERLDDENRYLKLRRIAIENLARIL